MSDTQGPTLRPLTQFICDTCNQLIEKPEDGWFEWLQYVDGKKLVSKNFRICHHEMKCMRLANHQHVSDSHLDRFIYPNGLSYLYSLVDVGPYHQKVYEGPQVIDLREWVEIMRRFTIPYYEEARQYWNEALSDGYFDGANEGLIYTPKFLENLIERYKDE